MTLDPTSAREAPRVGRAIGLVPAAGRSRRMGREKLLLPWPPRGPVSGTLSAAEGVPPEETVLGRVLGAWLAAGLDAVVVVAHRDDRALHDVVRHFARQGPVALCVPEVPPPYMKTSLLAGIAWSGPNLATRDKGAEDSADFWVAAPADLPRLRAETIARVVEDYRRHGGPAAVATHAGRRGHPLAFGGEVAAALATLGPDQGLRDLLERYPPRSVEARADAVAGDLDLPADYTADLG